MTEFNYLIYLSQKIQVQITSTSVLSDLSAINRLGGKRISILIVKRISL